nr:hypothetical transcript [Hymenolepis microstoma]
MGWIGEFELSERGKEECVGVGMERKEEVVSAETCTTQVIDLDRQLSRFVVPLTAALKGDGSAVFLATSAIFIAQLTNTPITSGMVVIIIADVNTPIPMLQSPTEPFCHISWVLDSGVIRRMPVQVFYTQDNEKG